MLRRPEGHERVTIDVRSCVTTTSRYRADRSTSNFKQLPTLTKFDSLKMWSEESTLEAALNEAWFALLGSLLRPTPRLSRMSWWPSAARETEGGGRGVKLWVSRKVVDRNYC